MVLENTLASDQLYTLADLYTSHFDPIDRNVRTLLGADTFLAVKKLYVVGDGDSYHAAVATRFAFMSRTDLEYHALPAMKFLAYEADRLHDYSPGQTMVVGISASGESRRVIQSLERAKVQLPGATVIAMTGDTGSTVAGVADAVLDVSIPDLGRTPGIRTYTASLFGLTALCLRFGELQGRFTLEETNATRASVAKLADSIAKTVGDAVATASGCARWAHTPFATVVGSGPHLGTAMFSAAKLVEIAGIHASAQDLEEWMHVERFAYPTDTPVIVIAPGGRSFAHALKMVSVARQLGHPLLVLTDRADDRALADSADALFPVTGEIEECFQHLLYYIPSVAIAGVLGSGIGRAMFMSHDEALKDERAALTGNLRETV